VTARRVFGVETEYAVTATTASGSALPADRVVTALLRTAFKTMPALEGCHDPGLFLSNGSRLYRDAGGHPELAGPECQDPWTTVVYLRAGDRILLELAEVARRRYRSIADLQIMAGNVDYSGTLATWGSHESYAYRSLPDTVRRALLPHLVSRVIYTGAGGFNPFSYGLEFTLSPRAHFLDQSISCESTHARGIIHTRDESLAASGWRRQHLICGESLRSDLASWLRVGTTAIVVAQADGGVMCGDAVALVDPVSAIRAVAADQTCGAGLELRDGSVLTPIDIQRHYLDTARRHIGAAFMPPWTEAVCTAWNAILDRLAHGPDAAATSLDWAIKRAIYRRHAGTRGFAWPALDAWSRVVDSIEDARRRPVSGPLPRLSALQLRSDVNLRDTVAAVTPVLDAAGLDWDGLDDFLTLRGELLELDVRWGLLGAMGLFESLDAAGVLDHRVPGVDGIEAAIDQPPAMGRARPRGLAIGRLSPDKHRYSAGWDGIWDHETPRRIDLSDPFCETDAWTVPALPSMPPRPSRLASYRVPFWERLQRVISR
jgi:proteasome accessory factor A